MNPGQDKHRLLIENLPDAFAYHQIITDINNKPVDYIFLDANPAFYEMTGFPKDKVIGSKITEIQPEITEADFDWIGTYGKVALTGRSIRFEQYSEMTNRWYEITSYSGEPGYFAVIFRDISEHKNSKEALKHNSGLITSLVDSIPDLVFYKDLDGIYLGCNAEFALHVGYEKEDIVGKTDYDLYSKEEADAFRENDRHRLELGTKRHNEEWVSYPDGRKVLHDTLKTPYYNADGKQIGTLGISRDITELKEAEKQVKENILILSWLNTIALEQAGVRNYESLIELVLEQLKKSTGAIVSVFNEYDAEKRVLITKKVKSEQKIIKKVIQIAGKSILNTVTPINDAIYEIITSSTIGYFSTLTEVTQGTVPASVSAAIQRLTGFNRFIVMGHVTEGKLYGTTMIGLGKGQADASLEFLESFAHITAISLRRLQAEHKIDDYTLELEQLYHHLDAELDKARQVHERTLPTALPDVEGISFAAHYQPAHKMGGDFYDVLHKDNKLIFYLSDVSGHGLDGAMLSVFIKHTIKNYISFTPTDNVTSAGTLHHLAGQFSKESYPEELYIAIFMAVLDIDTMELTYCGAGFQEALLLQLEGGEKLKLNTKGLFITSYLPVEMLKLKEECITLTSGTTIFCNTDGLTEQGTQGAYYRDKLPKIFYKNSHLQPQLIVQSVLDDFREFNNGSLQGNDDITFLVLKLEEETP